MTRFKKGSKVEVLDQREVPSGSWRSAEIVSGNGHNYYVKYDCYSPVEDRDLERVPRKAIRPCPPVLNCSKTWVPGDIVEVFDNGSWKTAQISKVVGAGYFLVRIVGLSRQFRVHESDLRLRQAWKDDKWIVIGQDSGKHPEEKINRSWEGKLIHGKPLLSNLNQFAGKDNLVAHDKYSEYPSLVPSKGLKRRRNSSLMAHTRSGKALRQEQVQQEFPVLSSRFHEKVDAVDSPQSMMGDKYMHASLNNRTKGLSELDSWRADSTYNLHLNGSGSESICSSVGSCSNSDNLHSSLHYPLNELSEDMDVYSDGAQSCSGSGQEPSLARTETSGNELHELELHAYHTTIAALYASGPISWEQEELLTNLRLMLHVSNDEHLSEIRHLVSSETKTPFR